MRVAADRPVDARTRRIDGSLQPQGPIATGTWSDGREGIVTRDRTWLKCVRSSFPDRSTRPQGAPIPPSLTRRERNANYERLLRVRGVQPSSASLSRSGVRSDGLPLQARTMTRIAAYRETAATPPEALAR